MFYLERDLLYMRKENTTFFVTGGGGYLGSVLVPMLLEHGYSVKVLDRFFWGKNVLAPHLSNKNLLLIEADTRSYSPNYLKGSDVVIDLAALSNDPIGELNPKITLDINYLARVRTAKLAKKMGVKKYILASSCSVYGFRDNILNEASEAKPITTYARASLLAENGVLPLSSAHFSVTVLRQGTLYGLSPRMRFDMVLNTMALSIFKNNIIAVQGGLQWRPILHVEDAASAFAQIAKTEPRFINGEIFNVGNEEQNYQIKDLAKLIVSTIDPVAQIITQEIQSDFRSYHVSFEKIKQTIEYQTKKTPQDGVKEIYQALKTKQVIDTMQTKTIDWYKHLLSQNPNILNAL